MLRNIVKKIYIFIFYYINKIYFNIYVKINKNKMIKGKTLVKDLQGDNVLIMVPHVDDDIIGCFGAILNYIRKEKKVNLVYLTNGAKQGDLGEKKLIIKERQDEAISVAKTIGIPEKNLHFMECEDGELIKYSSKIITELRKLIINESIDTIFLPCMLDTHTDHYACTKILYDVFYGLESTKEVKLVLYESQSPVTIYYANVCLDITEDVNYKYNLLRMYKSQPSDFKFAIEQNKLNGMPFNKRCYCELYIEVEQNKYFGLYKTNYMDIQKYYKLKEVLVGNGHSGTLIRSFKSSVKHKKNLKKII